jgi:hypothetical protein
MENAKQLGNIISNKLSEITDQELDNKILTLIKKEMELLKEGKGIAEDSCFCEQCEKRMTHSEKKKYVYFTRAVYVIFTFIWLLLCLTNNFCENLASFVLFIPFIVFLFGFFNAEETCNSEVETDVFGVSFIALGILISMPLLTLFNKEEDKKLGTSEVKIQTTEEINKRIEKEKNTKLLNHVVFISVICVLLIYLPIWVGYHERHICKSIRSCLETFSITLYIYALMIFFTH